MRFVHFSSLLLVRRSTFISKQFNSVKNHLFKAQRFSMSTGSTSVKSRQQPQWLVPTANSTPVLKFQNSLTKTKVRYMCEFQKTGALTFWNRPNLSPRAVDVSLGIIVGLLCTMLLIWVMLEPI